MLPVNVEVLKENKIKEIENKLNEVISEARLIGLSQEELKEMLELLYDEG